MCATHITGIAGFTSTRKRRSHSPESPDVEDNIRYRTDLAVPRMGSRMIVYYCPGLAFVRCHSDPLACLMIPMLFGNMTVSNG